MASVYRAYEPALDRYVALKVLPRQFLHDPSFAERFRREAQVIARLEHPNIIPIYAFDIDRERVALDGDAPDRGRRALAAGAAASACRSSERRDPARGGRRARLRARQGRRPPRHQAAEHPARRDGRVYLADFGIARSSRPRRRPHRHRDDHRHPAVHGAGAGDRASRSSATPTSTPSASWPTRCSPASVPFAADTPVAVLMKHVQEPLPMGPLAAIPEALLRPCSGARPRAGGPLGLAPVLRCRPRIGAGNRSTAPATSRGPRPRFPRSCRPAVPSSAAIAP